MISMELKDDRSEKVRYDYSDYPIYIRRGLLSTYPGYSAPTHWHDEIEFIVILSGEMQYNVNGEIVFLKEQEGIIVNARQFHFGFSAAKKECDFICILLHPLLLCTSPAYEQDFVMPVLRNQSAAFFRLTPSIPWQKEALAQIQSMYAVKNEKTAPLQVQNSLIKIWLLLYENMIQEDSPRHSGTDLTTFKNMLGFIQQNYSARISLADIAASGAIGQSKCCKLFHRYISRTPNEYLTEYRLNKSTSLLADTDLTITEIAAATGFGGSSYFAEAFRRWSGMSPSEYRKKQASGGYSSAKGLPKAGFSGTSRGK